MNIDDMSPERLATYTHSATARNALTILGEHIATTEYRHPGFVAALTTLPQPRQDEALWETYRGSDLVDLRLDTNDTPYALVARPNYPDDADWMSTPIPGADVTPRRTIRDHCVEGFLCDECQYQTMSPTDRAEWDSQPPTRPGRRGTGTPAAHPGSAQLADWERDLLAQQSWS